MSTRPLVGSKSPAMMLKSVLLPQPDGPIRLTKRPWGIVRLTGASASKTPLGVLNRIPTSSRWSFAGPNMTLPVAFSETLPRAENPARSMPPKNAGRHCGGVPLPPVGLLNPAAHMPLRSSLPQYCRDGCRITLATHRKRRSALGISGRQQRGFECAGDGLLALAGARRIADDDDMLARLRQILETRCGSFAG